MSGRQSSKTWRTACAFIGFVEQSCGDRLLSATEAAFAQRSRLTTNRPEDIEPAIASRPGRVDQTIAISLPDADCRRRLLALYGREARLGETEFADLVRRTDGASAAFIKELLRRAMLRWINEPRGDGTMDRVLVQQAAVLGAQLASARKQAAAPPADRSRATGDSQPAG